MKKNMKVEDLMSIPKSTYTIQTNRKFRFNDLSSANQDKIIQMINLIAEASKYKNDLYKMIDKANKNLETFINTQKRLAKFPLSK